MTLAMVYTNLIVVCLKQLIVLLPRETTLRLWRLIARRVGKLYLEVALTPLPAQPTVSSSQITTSAAKHSTEEQSKESKTHVPLHSSQQPIKEQHTLAIARLSHQTQANATSSLKKIKPSASMLSLARESRRPASFTVSRYAFEAASSFSLSLAGAFEKPDEKSP